MSSATAVFSIPELLELILLALPSDTIYAELCSIRTIRLCQTVSRTWHALVAESTPLRERLYLPTPTTAFRSREAWTLKSAFPPAQPNPWIPQLLLQQRSWGQAYPFTDPAGHIEADGPSQPRQWTFSFEMPRTLYKCLPRAGVWRDMLATDPPFTGFWYTRCFYEMGFTTFVDHLDFDPAKSKAEQKYRRCSPDGVTLGMIADAVSELFERSSRATFVMVESLKHEE